MTRGLSSVRDMESPTCACSHAERVTDRVFLRQYLQPLHRAHLLRYVAIDEAHCVSEFLDVLSSLSLIIFLFSFIIC